MVYFAKQEQYCSLQGMSPIARNSFGLYDSYTLLQSRYEFNLEHNQLYSFLTNSTNLFTGHSNTDISLLFEDFFPITSWTLHTKPCLSLNIFNTGVIGLAFWIVLSCTKTMSPTWKFPFTWFYFCCACSVA